MAFLDLTGLSYFLIRLHNTFASKEVFSRLTDGLVPHPTTNTSTRFLREDGSWEIPTDTNTDINVVQSNNSSNNEYPVLLKNGTGTGTITSSVIFNGNVTVNASTGTITAKTFKGNISPSNSLSTSDIDKMFAGTYSATGLKIVDDTVIQSLVDRIKKLETHALLDSDF